MAEDYLLDTDVLLRFCDAASAVHAEASDAVAGLLERGDKVYITTPKRHRIPGRRHAASRGERLRVGHRLRPQEVERILNLFLFIDDSPAISAIWLRLVTTHSVHGKQVHDARQAGVVEANGISNLPDFQHAGLRAPCGREGGTPRSRLLKDVAPYDLSYL